MSLRTGLARLRRVARRVLARLVYALLGVFIALSVCLYLLTGTATGTHWLLTSLIGYSGLPLSFARSEGSLLGGLHLEGVRWHDPAMDLSVTQAYLRWRVLDLFAGQIHIQRLSADGIRYVQHATPSPPTGGEASAPFTLAVPLAIHLDSLQLRDIDVALADGQHYPITRLTGRARLHGERLHLGALSLTAPHTHLSLQGRATLASPYALRFHLQGQGQLPDGTPLAGRAEGQGDLSRLQLVQQLSQPFATRLTGTVNVLEPQADLKLTWQQAQWPLHGTADVRSPQGQLGLRGTPDDYRLTLQTRLQVPNPGIPKPVSTRLEIEAKGSTQHLVIERLWADALGGQLQGTGRLAWQPSLNWQTSLQGKQLDPALQWPDWPGRLDFTAQAHGDASTLHLDLDSLSGVLRGQPARAQLQAVVQLATPPAQPQTRVQLSHARIQALGARLQADGELDARRGKLRFQLAVPQLAALLPEAHGSVQAEGRLDGPWLAPRVDARADGKTLRYEQLSIAALHLRVRPLDGTGSLSANPAANTASGPALQLRLEASGMQRADLRLDRLRLRADGRLTDHHLSLQAEGPTGNLALDLTGGWQADGQQTGGKPTGAGAGYWSGTLQRLTLTPATPPTRNATPAKTAAANKPSGWRLATPAAMRVGSTAVHLARACLRPVTSATGDFCTELDWQPRDLQLKARWKALPLALVNPWLPDQARLSGVLDGEAALQGPPAAPDGELQASLSAGRLQLVQSEGKTRDFDFALPRLVASLKQGRLEASASARLPGDGRVEASLQGMTGANPTALAAPLQGQLQLKVPSLQPLEGLIPDSRNLQGQIEATLRLDGSRAQPRLHSSLHLHNGAVTLLTPGIRLEAVQLDAESQPGAHGLGEALHFTASARSGGGTLQAKGQLSGLSGAPTDTAGKPGLKLEAQIQGERFEAIHLPQLEARISPQLELNADADILRLRGKLTVPQARIRVRRLPASAVTVSPDVEIVGATPPTTHGPGLDVSLDLALGDDVRIDAFGLTGRLGGNLLLQQQASAPASADGTLRILDGSYTAYGLKLAISRGVLNFAGPVDNPALDVVAQRQSGEVTAQLNVSGTLKSPRSRVSATPPMSEAEALSWLLTGHGLGEASKSDAGLLLKAVASMHVQDEDGGLMQTLQQRTGLSEISVQGGSTLQQSSLLLGKALSPDLYLRYTTGLFEHSSTLSLNYQLSRHFSVEAKSGSAQGIDLLYQIVFGKR